MLGFSITGFCNTLTWTSSCSEVKAPFLKSVAWCFLEIFVHISCSYSSFSVVILKCITMSNFANIIPGRHQNPEILRYSKWYPTSSLVCKNGFLPSSVVHRTDFLLIVYCQFLIDCLLWPLGLIVSRSSPRFWPWPLWHLQCFSYFPSSVCFSSSPFQFTNKIWILFFSPKCRFLPECLVLSSPLVSLSSSRRKKHHSATLGPGLTPPSIGYYVS